MVGRMPAECRQSGHPKQSWDDKTLTCPIWTAFCVFAALQIADSHRVPIFSNSNNDNNFKNKNNNEYYYDHSNSNNSNRNRNNHNSNDGNKNNVMMSGTRSRIASLSKRASPGKHEGTHKESAMISQSQRLKTLNPEGLKP